MKKQGIPVKGVRISKDGKLERDYDAEMAKLPVNKRIAKKKSRKVTVSKAPRLKSG